MLPTYFTHNFKICKGVSPKIGKKSYRKLEALFRPLKEEASHEEKEEVAPEQDVN